MRSLLEEEEKEEEEEVLGAASAPVGDMETPRASSARRRDGSILREEKQLVEEWSFEEKLSKKATAPSQSLADEALLFFCLFRCPFSLSLSRFFK
jgi:hypothetical protein